MYEKRRAKSATFCYTLITIALLAGTVAVVVSWLLATGVIDPDRRETYKEARRLDIFSDLNSLEADIAHVTFPQNKSENVTITLTNKNENTEITSINEEIEIKNKINNLNEAILNNIDEDIQIETNIEKIESNENTTDKSKNNVEGVKATTNALTKNEKVPDTTVSNVSTEEDKIQNEESTEPFTVTSFTTSETEKEENAITTLPSPTIVDILSGNLKTTMTEKSKAETTTMTEKCETETTKMTEKTESKITTVENTEK